MSSPTEPTFSADFNRLLEAARNGDKEAQGRLLGACRLPLLRLARRQLRPSVQSKGGGSDMVQDALFKATQEIQTFQGCTPEQLMAWLRAIVTHTTTDFVRQFTTGKRQVEKETTQVSESLGNDLRRAEPSASETAIHHEQVARVKAAVDRLPAHYAEVVRLRYEERLSFEEIGVKTGRTAEAARKRFARAVDLLAGVLA